MDRTIRKDKRIYYAAAIVLALLYYLATATGYDALALVPVLFIGCWIIWNVRQDEQTLND